MPRTAATRKPLPFQQLQYRFAAHLRNPKKNAAPRGIEERRLQVYRDLFYNNVEGFLAKAFPVLRKITADSRWHAMVRDFFARHESHDPQFHRIAAEFLDYLENERGQARGDPPFLRELAHYEWVELALSVDEAEITPDLADPDGDLLEGVPVVSPLAWSLNYGFAVHRIGPGFLPEVPGAMPTHLVVWRDQADRVNFMEANPVTARLLQLLESRRRTGRSALKAIARELKHPEPDAIVREGAELLRGLRGRGIVLGTLQGKNRRKKQ